MPLNKQATILKVANNTYPVKGFIYLVLFSLFIMVYSPPSLSITSLKASIDKNPIMSNESLVLTVVADDSVDRDELDTTNLLKDFIIGRVSVSSQTSMVNFTTSKTTRWTIVLIPRSSGNLEIGSLSVDNIKSLPIAVEVIDIDSAQAQTNKSLQQQDIFLTAEVTQEKVYVQQLLTLKVKLHIAVNLERASLSDPSLPHGIIKTMGEDIKTQEIINGKRYHIIERSFAITPEKSGEFDLITPSFSGEVLQQSQRRSSFFNMNDTKPVHVLGKRIAITVLPVPDSFTSSNNAWLPSEMLSLHQEWQPSSDNFVVGEPITRTITLTAAGISEEQLPSLDVKAPKGMKIYPDQAKNHSRSANDRLVSQKKQNFALVVNKPGKYTIPEVSVAWWNTVTNRAELATLPEQVIIVKENPDIEYQQNNNAYNNGNNNPLPSVEENASSGETTSTHNNSNTSPSESDIKALAQQQKQLIELQQTVENNARLMWLFLALWLITILAWCVHVFIIRKKAPSLEKPSDELATPSHKKAYLNLLAACKQNKSKEALKLITPWFNQLPGYIGTDALSLEEVLEKLNDEAIKAIVVSLQQSCYGKSSAEYDEQSAWHGDELAKAIQRIQLIQGKDVKKNADSEMRLNP